MRLFKGKGTYIFVFCVYAVNALFLLFHTVKTPPLHTTSLTIVVPQVIGMSLLAVIALVAIRRTSSAIERGVLVLTSVICALFVARVAESNGCDLPALLYSHSVFVVVSCVAALLAGWRLLEVAVTERAHNQ
jgi:4-amino-4-deoxy-L-arabinose transferase-like glycosyltransferase